MLYPEITNIIDFSKENQYSASEESSSLRKALANFLAAEGVTFNSLGDVFIYGRISHDNHHIESFAELAWFFLWFNRSWLRLVSYNDNIYFASPLLEQGIFRSKWDASLITFKKILKIKSVFMMTIYSFG